MHCFVCDSGILAWFQYTEMYVLRVTNFVASADKYTQLNNIKIHLPKEHSAILVAYSSEILTRGHGIHVALPRTEENCWIKQSVNGLNLTNGSGIQNNISSV